MTDWFKKEKEQQKSKTLKITHCCLPGNGENVTDCKKSGPLYTLEILSRGVGRCGQCQINLLQSVLIVKITENLDESALHLANLKLPYETITSL